MLFQRNIINIDVALINVSPPDQHGFCSMGASVDITSASDDKAGPAYVALGHPRLCAKAKAGEL